MPSLEMVRIAAGYATPAQRLAMAIRHVRPAPTRRSLAQAVGVHPSALSPSNFKVTPQELERLAQAVGVAGPFLVAGTAPWPGWISAEVRAVERIRAAARALLGGRRGPDVWQPDAWLGLQDPETVMACCRARAVDVEPGLVSTLISVIRESGPRPDDAVTVTLPRRDWLAAIECLASYPGPEAPLDHPAWRVAARLHAAIVVHP
ncbi:MAG: hypothetical protein RLZZ127_160 [Planctomycetota bacterium]|jgi:hypothetical protein